jgi:subtilisin family serine protease
MSRSLPTALALLALSAGSAHAALPAPPMTLPGDARAARAPADPGTWIVASRDVRAARPLARRYGATAVGSVGAHVVPRRNARAFAAALRRRGLLSFAEPNILSRARATGTDPFTANTRWRPMVVEQGLEPPAVTSRSPKLALIDSKLDLSHPEFAGGRIGSVGSGPVEDEHGTATAAVAAAPTNGQGIEGVWPGMIATNFATDLSCGDIVRRIRTVVRDGYDVLNMSYGASEECFAESAELQRATGAGVLLVAAAGNEFAEGNPLEYPASLPHVVTVAAVDLEGRTSYFSNANAAIDLAAPGEGVATAVPFAHDPDGDGNGYALLDGTSFAAPIVAGAAAWVAAARPRLTVDQLANVVKLSAIDLDEDGWDQNTGYGLLQVGNALRVRPPKHDPLEPNENIFWVNGKVFQDPDPVVYDRRPRRRRFQARVDQYEDPADVYRARFPARSRVKITVVPSYGDTDLAVYNARAKNTSARPVARSRRAGSVRDSLVIENGRRRRALGYVEVYIDPFARGLDAGYSLRFKRVR